MAAQLTILLATIQLGFLLSLVSTKKFHILPECNIPSPTLTGSGSFPATSTDHSGSILDEDCLTLTQYAQSSATTIDHDSNITLIIDPGNHTLSSRLEIQNVNNLVLQTTHMNSFPILVAIVTCTNSAGFNFSTISEIIASGLEFRNCQENSVRSVDQLRMEDCRFEDGHGIELRNVTISTFERCFFISLTAFKMAKDQYLERYVLSGGAIVAFSSDIRVTKCLFEGNTVDGSLGGGGAIRSDSGKISIYNSNFSSNTAAIGGALWTESESGSISIYGSDFNNNTADYRGGAIKTISGDISINASNLSSNRAIFGAGGAIFTSSGSIWIHGSNFNRNSASSGGAIETVSGNISICGNFYYNTVDKDGGAIRTENGSIRISDSVFIRNIALNDGGVLFLGSARNSVNEIDNTVFKHNNAINHGAPIFVQSRIISLNGLIQITDNSATTGVFYALRSTMMFSGNTTISNNRASIYIIESKIKFNGKTNILKNFHCNDSGPMEGGAITAFQSEITFNGTVNILDNAIINGSGGAILMRGSMILSLGNTTIAYNTALFGGGIYGYNSELNFTATTSILGNNATKKGGGIYISDSTVRLTGAQSQLELIENRAEKGGGICLESNAKLHLIKAVPECSSVRYNPDCVEQSMSSLRLCFTNNLAKYGGALYISDDTLELAECFFQDLASHNVSYDDLIIQNTFFTNNSASVSGASIFGGRLDRCTVSPNAQILNKRNYKMISNNSTVNALSYLTQITNLKTNAVLQSEISSEAIQVCFCTLENDQLECDSLSRTYTFKATTLFNFNVSVVAVDQVRNRVLSSVRALSTNPGLAEGQDNQNTTSNCTNLSYTMPITQKSEQLVLNIEDQDFDCKSTIKSQIFITLMFTSCTCPIGFVLNQSTCNCQCDPCLSNYITDCNVRNYSVKRSDNVWITFTKFNESKYGGYQNETKCPYLTYPHCPFDYCHPSSSPVWINLNITNGSDAQCAFNRSGTICGSCKDGLSLSLGSSRCMSCSNNWLALLFVFAIAGVALVAFLLVCNLTVAVGTINGLIFYANILATNRATFFPFQSSNFFTVFIAWLNLDFGFVTCFFDGMDGYVKEWLQIAFPIYIILLVTMVIIGCEYSTRIARLFIGTNPVATLATLILLSYAKSLRVIIAALSFATLKNLGGSQEIVWLIDGNIRYFEEKHIPLFLVALLILLMGIVYTSLLFSYQWLLRCPNRKGFKWIKNARFYPFMDAYLAPYNLKYRYWTGLLLLIRAFLYVLAALNVSGDPGNNLLAIFCTLICLHFIRFFFLGRIYKLWLLDALNFTFMMNLIFFSFGSLYIRAYGRKNQESLAYASTSIAFITFLVILTYHIYTFVLPKKTQTKVYSFIIKIKIQFTKQEPTNPEIILVPRPVVTYSVVDPVPTHHQLLENTKKLVSIKQKREATTIEPEQTSDENKSPSKQTAESTIGETKMDKLEDEQQKETVNIEFESRHSNICFDPNIKDYDKLGMKREMEISDITKLAD